MLVLGLGFVLFVVICPLTPTPNAVIKKVVDAVAGLLFLGLAGFVLVLAQRIAAPSTSHPLPVFDLTDLTCVRLC